MKTNIIGRDVSWNYPLPNTGKVLGVIPPMSISGGKPEIWLLIERSDGKIVKMDTDICTLSANYNTF